MKRSYGDKERRGFLRLDYVAPFACKICKKRTVSKLLQGYTSNVSPSGLLCNIKETVKKGDLLWLSFNRDVLEICENLEKRSVIYQNGVIGKVVRIVPRKDKTYDVGIQFITREEKNLTNIYPKIHFLKDLAEVEEQPSEEELEEEAVVEEIKEEGGQSEDENQEEL